MKLKLHWQIFISMGMGLIIGLIFQYLYSGSPTGSIYNIITSLGTIFIRLLKMVIVPLIMTSIITGVSGIGGGKSLGRVGIKTFLYYITTSLFAIFIGLTLTNVIQPGSGANLGVHESFDHSKLQKPGSAADILIRMIPLNPFQAASSGDMLGIIFFSIFLGVALTRIDSKHSEIVKNFFSSTFEVMMEITQIIIRFAPLGVFGLITEAIAVSGFNLFVAVGKYMITIVLGLSVHCIIILPMLFYILTGTSPRQHFSAMASALATAFATSSSNATLPVTMRCIEQNIGVSNKISSFVLPMGATINMDGTALYECAGVLFISQALGIELTITQQFIVVITALLASVGAAGIPSAGLVMIFIVTQAVGFDNADVAIIVGAMLAVDRPLDMMRTMVNIFSDSVGAAIIAKSEGETLYDN